jgi:hypothetical protein
VRPWVVRTRSASASCCSLGFVFHLCVARISQSGYCVACVTSLVILMCAECAANLNLYWMSQSSALN